MYGYGYQPGYCCPVYNDGNNFSWVWAIIIIVFIVFFLCWGSGSRRGNDCYNSKLFLLVKLDKNSLTNK